MVKLNSHFLSLALFFLFLSPSSAHYKVTEPSSDPPAANPLSPSSSDPLSPSLSVSDSPLPSYADSPLPSHSESPPSTYTDTSSNSDPSSNPLMGKFKGLFSKVFAFGDSYTDTGNANFMGGGMGGPLSGLMGGQGGGMGGPLSNMMGGKGPLSSMMGGKGPLSNMMEGKGPLSSMMSGKGPLSSMMSGKGPLSSMMGGGMGGGMGGDMGGGMGDAIKQGINKGHKVVDYLCDAFQIPHLSPYKDGKGDFSHGVNFAFGGGLPGLFDHSQHNHSMPHSILFQGVAKALQTQKEWFHDYVQNMACKGKDERACKEDIGKALFWIGATGVNDYTRISGFKMFNLQKLADNCIIHISQLMKELLNMGAKNIVVHGLPPVGCLPSSISLCPLKNFDKLGCSLAINTGVMIHNRILQRMIVRFHNQYPDAKILYADYWNAFLKILTHPKEYNFLETTKACCGSGGGQTNFNVNQMCGAPGTFTCKDPSKYMSWDGIHLTDAMHQHISDLFLNQNFCRPSFAQAFKNKIGM
ncbi:GDSL esterase/lipase At3g48460-like [Cornus florida]|uniref:GDSL esterase/lipase At3g48460-like n=1 Tax=Cornus florida TaxID=4283 RepID=UPI0028982C6B|nr:GDSL esterase/lipase At3g48460-like [Cornus florida]